MSDDKQQPPTTTTMTTNNNDNDNTSAARRQAMLLPTMQRPLPMMQPHFHRPLLLIPPHPPVRLPPLPPTLMAAVRAATTNNNSNNTNKKRNTTPKFTPVMDWRKVLPRDSRSHAIAYHYVHVLGCPPPDQWKGPDGTIQKLKQILQLPKARDALTVMERVYDALQQNVLYDPYHYPSRQKQGRKELIPPGSEQAKVLVASKRAGRTLSECAADVNGWIEAHNETVEDEDEKLPAVCLATVYRAMDRLGLPTKSSRPLSMTPRAIKWREEKRKKKFQEKVAAVAAAKEKADAKEKKKKT